MFGRFRRGVTPADVGEDAYESFEDAPLDQYDSHEDGDNGLLHAEYKHLVTKEQIGAAMREEPK